MKYTNTFNGHTYWIESNKVKVSNGEVTHTSNMDVETFNTMIENGDMVEIPVNRENFRKLVCVAKSANPNYQIRFLAFVEHNGKDAWAGNVAVRNARFMSWISDRKKEYTAHCNLACPELVLNDTIVDQDNFTDFIISGLWIK